MCQFPSCRRLARNFFRFPESSVDNESFGWTLPLFADALEKENQKGHAPSRAPGRWTAACMKAKRQFPEDILAVLREGKGLRIRAGTSQHRFIGVWVVVVKDRVFVRSWSVKPNGWFRTFMKEPRGAIQVADHEIAVRAVLTRDERLRDVVDRSYLEKYNTAGALKYAKDLGSPKSRATTIELVPSSSTH